MTRKPAKPYWLVVEDFAARRRLVGEILHTAKVNKAKVVVYHGVPEDVAIAGVEYAQEDKPDAQQEGWYNAVWNSPRGPLWVVYFIEVNKDGKTLKIFDAYPVGREFY